MKNIVKKIANFLNLKELGKKAITVIILTLTAIITVWVYAAFVEPTAGPNDSDQDFVQNILGANNADNDFDSSLVTANKNGSIIEIVEYMREGLYTTECGESTATATSTCYVDDTAKYVGSNACSAASNSGYCFMNTATFSAMDSDLVAGNIKTGVTIFGVTGTAKSLGTACTAGSECASDYCVDGVCCNNACTGSTCQRCDSYSNAGAGTCGYISTAVDPDNECPGALACANTTCSGSSYGCAYLAEGEQSCGACKYCTGSSYTCSNRANTDWNAGAYSCTGSGNRCYSGSCTACGGWMYNTYCWYYGPNTSCTTLCSTHGGVYNGSCDWVNDPTNCSTAGGLITSCNSCNGLNWGPAVNITTHDCYYHIDGNNDCTSNSALYRVCACNY